MNETVLGIDVGCKNIGIALVKNGKKPSILNSAYIPTPKESIADGEIKDIFLLAETIKKACTQNRIKAKKIALCISSSQSGIREFALPALKDKEIYPAVEMELSKTFKGIEQTHSISYKVYEKSKDGIKGIVSFCPRKIVEEYIKLGYEIGTELKYLDINANCITKAYSSFMKNSDSQDGVVIVDIGSNISQVNVIAGDKLIISRNVPVGGNSIDRIVAEELSISVEKAEMDKINQYKDYIKRGYYPDEFVKKGYAGILQEVGQTLSFLYKSHSDIGITRIYLIGGGSRIANIEMQFNEAFKIPAYAVRPTDNHSIYISEFSNLMSALGAAVRED